jgi:hypothetical protein
MKNPAEVTSAGFFVTSDVRLGTKVQGLVETQNVDLRGSRKQWFAPGVIPSESGSKPVKPRSGSFVRLFAFSA